MGMSVNTIHRGRVVFSQEWLQEHFSFKKGLLVVGAEYRADLNEVHLHFIDTEGKTFPRTAETATNQAIELEKLQCPHQTTEWIGDEKGMSVQCCDCGKILRDDFK